MAKIRSAIKAANNLYDRYNGKVSEDKWSWKGYTLHINTWADAELWIGEKEYNSEKSPIAWINSYDFGAYQECYGDRKLIFSALQSYTKAHPIL